MKEKELRLALVCFGGVSLVLYMQGIIKEFLKLIRASKAYHSIDDPQRRRVEAYASANGNDGYELDTEAAYFSLLQRIGEKLNLRVVIDSIAGASAGGISGIILARALAHDLNVDHLRKRWLEEADVLRLLGKSQRARAWSKWFLYPPLWVLLRSRVFGLTIDREVRGKLSAFLRSHWFEAPFDGDGFLELLIDGLHDMRRSGVGRSSLLPPGHVLDLSVSVTDFYGYPRQISINSPNFIEEREQSLLWTFTYCHWKDGREVSDLDDDNVPGLAFAARATSSFPGAFAPAQLADIDRVLKRRDLKWKSRSKFISGTFKEQMRAGIDPNDTSFIDGSIVNAKPFSAAINAIRERAAYREVDRRLVYVNPDPEPASLPHGGHVPGFLQTLESAIFEIPTLAPIHGELSRLAQLNESINRLRTVFTAARPEFVRLVGEIVATTPQAAYTGQLVAQWRGRANELAATRTGYAYQVYARFKTALVLDRLTALISEFGGLAANSAAHKSLASEIRMWADRHNVMASKEWLWGHSLHDEGRAWIEFLLHFDVAYRHRRLSFVLRGINELYSRLEEPEFAGVESQHLDEAKSQIQEPLHRLRMLRSGGFASAILRKEIADLGDCLRATPTVDTRTSAIERIDSIMHRLSGELDLPAVDRALDHIAASSDAKSLPIALRRELLTHYLGFSFWDVWSLPVLEWHEIEEHSEIRVDRICPADAHALQGEKAGTTLKGAKLRHFAGFFSRSIRENDYLWGRLNGAERLIDIVCDAAAVENVLEGIDISAVKKAAFLAILDTEDEWLQDKRLLTTIRKLVESL